MTINELARKIPDLSYIIYYVKSGHPAEIYLVDSQHVSKF